MGLRQGKAWIDGKSDGANLFHGDAEGVERLSGGLVGNDPEVGLGGGPETVDGDGVGNDGNKLERGAQFLGETGDQVGVDGEGENDNAGTEGFDDLAEAKVSGLIDEERIFNEGQVVASDIEKIPAMRVAIDECKVEATEKIVKFGARLGKGIGDMGGTSAKADGGSESLGGGIMTIAKSSGENEDGRRIHIRPSRSSSSRRRSSDWSTISVMPVSSRRMSRQRAIFSAGRPVVSMTRRPRVR